MEETKEKKETTAEPEKSNTADEPVDLIEMVREKHQEQDLQSGEKLRDIFTVQLILCILIVLVLFILNIFDKDLTKWYILEFKRMTLKQPEKIIKDAVDFIMGYIK